MNLLVALREEGEIPRDIALSELAARAETATRAVSSVPGLGAVSAFSYGYLKRVPGADVALGVTAYQIAASAQAAVTSARRGRGLVRDVANVVGGVLERTIEEMDDITDQGLELARHTIRGAINVGDDLTDQLGRVARGAVLGALRTMAEQGVDPGDALYGAGYGAVQGAVEANEDPAIAATYALEAAREAATELGVTDEEAAAALVKGALDAAEASGDEALAAVRQALPNS